MIKFHKSKSLIKYFIIWIILSNLIYADQKYTTLDLTTSLGENELNQLHFDDNSKTNKCNNWIPALFNPIMLVHFGVDMNGLNPFNSFEMTSPVFQTNGEEIDISLYYYKFFDQYDEIVFGKNFYNKEIIKQCYFGLSKGLGNYQIISENQINLNMLKNKKFLDEKIFSFDKWIINKDKNTINSFLYLGDIHENFLSKNGIIGTCKAEEKDSYWGCSFKEMNFNNNIISLNNKDKNTNYKIFFSSENHLIIFPESFKEEFNKKTNNICKEDENSKYLYCNDLFNSENYFSIKLIDDNMTITIEVDNWNRFTLTDSPNEKNKTRIIFDNNEFFIFPLIMFKNFHVQFNSNDNIISFYTTNEKILELKKKEEDKPERKEDENDSSNAGIIILIIVIVLLILFLGFGVFWFVKKRRSSGDKNINKYNKFEEDETFQNMNEKRVF